MITCWHNKDSYGYMIQNFRNHPPLQTIEHGKVLYNLLNKIDNTNLKLIDLGCGTGLSSTIIKSDYTGADLSDIIDNVTLKCLPNLNYLKTNVLSDDLLYLNGYDIVLTNALLDVIEEPLYLLEKILSNSKKYVIIHRQKIIIGETKIINNPSYGGITHHSMINCDDFYKMIQKYNYQIVENLTTYISEPEWRSFLLQRFD